MEENKNKNIIVKWLWRLLFFIPVGLIVGLLLIVWLFADIPSFEELENPDSKLATQVIAEGGESLPLFILRTAHT